MEAVKTAVGLLFTPVPEITLRFNFKGKGTARRTDNASSNVDEQRLADRTVRPKTSLAKFVDTPAYFITLVIALYLCYCALFGISKCLALT